VARKISVEREREIENTRSALSLLSLSLPSTLLLSRPLLVVSRRMKTEDGEETREVKKRRKPTDTQTKKSKTLNKIFSFF